MEWGGRCLASAGSDKEAASRPRSSTFDSGSGSSSANAGIDRPPGATPRTQPMKATLGSRSIASVCAVGVDHDSRGLRRERGLSELKTALLISPGRSWFLSWPSSLLAPPFFLYQQRAAQRSSGLKVMSLVSSVPCCVSLGTALPLSGPLPSHLTSERALKRWTHWPWSWRPSWPQMSLGP